MTDNPVEEGRSNQIHWSFWLISGIAFIWNLMGALNFMVQLDPEMVAAYRESERIIIQSRPMWATAGFALAVFGGTIGALLMLFKRAVAYQLFIASLLGVLITMAHSLTSDIAFGMGEIIGIILMPVLFAGFLIGYSRLITLKNWLK